MLASPVTFRGVAPSRPRLEGRPLMRTGSALLALALSAALTSSGMAQSSTDPLAIPPAKTGVKPVPQGTKAKKPSASSRVKKPTLSRSERLIRAQRAAEARFNLVAPQQIQQPQFGGDPLGLAAGSPGVLVYGSPPIVGQFPYGGGFAVAGTGGGLFSVPGVGTLAATGSQATQTATGGLVGTSDTRLIRGF